MHRLILFVAGLAILVVFGGQRLSNNQANAQDTPGVVATTFADYAKQSLKVGDKALFSAGSSIVVLLTEDQSIALSTYPKGLVTVTGIGKDYFVVRGEKSAGSYSKAFGTDMMESVVRFESVTAFSKFVSSKE